MGESGIKLNRTNAPNHTKNPKKTQTRNTDNLVSQNDISGYSIETSARIKKKFGRLADNLFYLLDKIPIGIALISRKTLDIIYANHAFLEIFRYDDSEKAPHLSWEDYLNPDSYREFLKSIALNKSLPKSFYLKIIHKNGETRDVEVNVSDMMSNDKDCSLVFFQDISVHEDFFSQSNHENINFESLLEAFSYRIIEIQEDERRKISYELHDELGQILTAIQLMLSRARLVSEKYNNPEHRESETLLKDAIERVRSISLDLNPHTIGTRGLIPTLTEYFKRYKIWSRMTVNFKHTGFQRLDVPDAINHAIYRIIQESLTNSARHAKAESVDVALQANRKEIRLYITDKGKGFNPEKMVVTKSGGLSGIYERILLLKGKLDLVTAPGKGTRLEIVIPLSDKSNGNRDYK